MKQNYLVELIPRLRRELCRTLAEGSQGYYSPQLCCDRKLISDNTSTALLRGSLFVKPNLRILIEESQKHYSQYNRNMSTNIKSLSF